MKIIKKCEKDMFERILSGKKKFEVRLGNLEINEGDILILKESIKGVETGRELTKKVGFLLKTKNLDYWSEKDENKFGFVVIQLED